MANAVVEEYIALKSMQRRWNAGAQAREFLEGELADMRIELERADQALLDFAQAQPGGRPRPAHRDGQHSTLNDLNQRLSDVETELVTLGAYRTMIERGQAADINMVNESEAIQACASSAPQLATEYASLSQRFKDDYPTLVELQQPDGYHLRPDRRGACAGHTRAS